MNVRIGADPETLLKDLSGNYISGAGLFGGTKDNPLPIGEGCAIQEDNVTVEFNIPPTNNVIDFLKYINFNLEHIENRAKELDLILTIEPSAIYSDEELDSFQAQTFGCEPDFNAWRKGARNPRPKTTNKNLRSAGGHIHIEAPDLNKIELTKAMDLFVGAQMLSFDTDKMRRKLYGKAGAFRPKDYGIEYRTPSNAWLKTDELKKWAFEQTQKAVQFVQSGKQIDEYLGNLLQKAINQSDTNALNELNLYANTVYA